MLLFKQFFFKKTLLDCSKLVAFKKCPTRSLQMQKSLCLPEVAWRERCQLGSFGKNTADGDPRLGVPGGIVNYYAIYCQLNDI